MKKDMKKISLGLFLMIAAVWGGSVVAHQLAEYSIFVIVITGLILFIIGGILIAKGLDD